MSASFWRSSTKLHEMMLLRKCDLSQIFQVADLFRAQRCHVFQDVEGDGGKQLQKQNKNKKNKKNQEIAVVFSKCKPWFYSIWGKLSAETLKSCSLLHILIKKPMKWFLQRRLHPFFLIENYSFCMLYWNMSHISLGSFCTQNEKFQICFCLCNYMYYTSYSY